MMTKKILLGKNIMVTRSKEQAETFVQDLEALGANVVLFPLIRIDLPDACLPMDEAIRNISSYQWLVFTSVNGVEAFMNRMKLLGIQMSVLKTLRLCAVGNATKKAIESYGLIVEVIPKEYTTSALLTELRQRVGMTDRVLMARADIADPLLSLGLQDFCANITDIVAYKTVLLSSAQKATLLEALDDIDYITLASASAVKSLANITNNNFLNKMIAICIGPVTLQEAKPLSFAEIHMADVYTVDGMVKKIVELEEKKGCQ